MADLTATSQGDGRSRRSLRDGEFDLEQVRTAVKGIRYGEVRVIIQDGVVVQIERVEKQRLR
ncbi:MAG: YezD family protein [Isosphaeraceae bacterium]|nr:YezD family protein [Isosphaeraceae bacterium]